MKNDHLIKDWREAWKAEVAENDRLRERVRNLQRIALEMHATLDHSAESRGETCWSCFLQGQLTEMFIGYDPARYDGFVFVDGAITQEQADAVKRAHNDGAE
jgi:hypothetical protein